MASPNATGLNVSTGQGEGAAHINHWDNFYHTINYIQQRDLTDQKKTTDAFNKSQLELAESSKGSRPADIPELKQYSDDFIHAALMVNDKDVRKDANKLAEWTRKKNDAFFSFQSLVEDGKNQEKFKAGINADRVKSKGVGYNPPEDIDTTFKEFDNTPTRKLTEKGLNTPGRYLLPPSTHDPKLYESDVFGKLIEHPDLKEIKDASGQTVAREKHQIQYYEHSPAEIANKTSHYIAGNYAIRSDAQRDYENDIKNDPVGVQKVFDDAQKVANQTPVGNVKPIIPTGYIGYSVSRNILKAQPKDVGTSEYIEDPDTKRRKDEAFKLKTQEANFANRKNMVILGHNLKKKDEQPPAVNTTLLWDAASHPSKQFEMKDSKGKTVYLSGQEVLDAGVQAISGDNPKGTDGIQLDRSSILDPKSRSRIVEKLFPNLSQGERDQILNIKSDPSKTPQDNRNDLVKKFTSKVNEVYGQNISPDDVSRYSIPVFINKSYVTEDDPTNLGKKTTRLVVKPTFINPATNNFGQFHSAISNQVTSKKKGQMAAENPNFIGALQMLSQDDDE